MAIQIGATNFGHIYVGSAEIAEAYFGSVKIFPNSMPIIQPNTLRLKYNQGYTPTFARGTSICVDQQNNIWDWSYNYFSKADIDATNLIEVVDGYVTTTDGLSQTFAEAASLRKVSRLYAPNSSKIPALFRGCTALQTVAGFQPSTELNQAISLFAGCSSLQSVNLFDTHTILSVASMFSHCSSIEYIPPFDFGNCTDMDTAFRACVSLKTLPSLNLSKAVTMKNTFEDCSSLTAIPSLNLSKVVYMQFAFNECTALTVIPTITVSVVDDCRGAFGGCHNVVSGALNMYNAFISQTTPPTSYTSTFTYCGSDTTTGQAELAQIPTSWGGTMA
jgi:hypothetical protein